MTTLTRPWHETVYCKRHGIEYDYVCNCTDPDWCDCDECPACQEEERSIANIEGLRDQMREEPE